MRKIVLILAVFTALLFNSCSSKSNSEEKDQAPVSVAEDGNMLPDELNQILDSYRDEEIKKNPERFEAMKVLLQYLEQDSDTELFSLNISQKDAEKLGVANEYYEETIKSIDDTNAMIKELKRQGVHINDFDLDKAKAELKVMTK